MFLRETVKLFVLRTFEYAPTKKKKAEDEIKEQIVDVSSALTEKLIEREINTEDHRKLIDSFISEMGELSDAE